MKLMTLQEVNTTPLDTRFKQSPIAQLIPAIICAGISIGAVYLHIFRDLSLVFAILFGGFFGLFARFCFSHFKKSLAPTNWILSAGPDQIAVKFRSWLNCHFPQSDPQVIEFHPSEIDSARITKQRITVPQRKGTTTSYHTFLDLNISGQDLTGLKEQLKYERNLRMPPTGRFFKSSGRSLHYPVSVMDNRIVRIEWRSPTDFVLPSIKKAVKLLGEQGIRIEALQKEIVDLTCNREDLKNIEDKILHLAERGNILAATRMARRAYNMSLADARTFVEELIR